jgi:hypothetical protein
VATDQQLVSPAGVLHVLDGAQILRFSLLSASARPALTLDSNADALAYLPALDSLVIARDADPPELTLRPLLDDANEVPFAEEALADPNSLCGMTTTDQQVVLCTNHNHYLVLDAAGEIVSEADVGDFIEPNAPDPNDPNAPVPQVQPSWDDMAWDGVTRTLYSVRNQGKLFGAFAVPIDPTGQLGEPAFADPNDILDTFPPDDPGKPDPNAPRTAQRLTLVRGGTHLIAPDGLEIATDPFQITTLPQLAKGELFELGDGIVTLGGAVGTAGCALRSSDLGLAEGALVSTGPIRSAERNGRAWILRGAAADAIVTEVFPQTGDLDRDHAPDSRDFFPFERSTGRDWDRDGIPDPNDAFPTNSKEWLDSDGDKVGDNEDAFPNDPTEQKDTDGDGVGDHADGCPDDLGDPNATTNSDSDSLDGAPLCDDQDAFPFDPLEQVDSDGDGVGDNGDADPEDPAVQYAPFGTPTDSFQVTVKRDARLSGFPHEVTTDSELLILFDDDRFALCAPADCEPGMALTGTFERRGKSGNKLKLVFDTAVMSKLELAFGQAGAELVAADTADPPSPTLTFHPNRVTSTGSATLGRKGASLGLRIDFRYGRDPGGRGTRGVFLYRAKGPPALSPSSAPRDSVRR